MDETEREILALSRAVAAQKLVTDHRARAEEYQALVDAVKDELSAPQAYSNYYRQSSPGAYLIARQTIAASEALGENALRESPLNPTQLRDVLVDVDDHIWLDTLMTGWSGADDQFQPTQAGLTVGLLAGLAESALTQGERHLALCQLSYCPSDTNRLSEVRKAIRNTQQILTVIPAHNDQIGVGYILAMAAMALHLPERALELVQQVPPDQELGGVLHELAQAGTSLILGEQVELAADDTLPNLEFESAAEVSLEPRFEAQLEVSDEEDEEEGILEIVEQVIDSEQDGAETKSRHSVPPSWSVGDQDAETVDEQGLRMWFDGRAQRRSFVGEFSGLLGLRPLRDSRQFRPLPPSMLVIKQLLEYHSEPPDPSTAETERIDVATFMATQRERLGMCSVRPLFPVVRSCLRAIARAPEGEVLSTQTLAASGDAHPYLARSRRLGLICEGRLDEAASTLGALDEQNLDELRIELVRKYRFEGRHEPQESANRFLDRARARQVAAKMVFDLSVNFAKTVSGVSI